MYPSLRRTDLSAAPGKDSLGNVFENDAKDIVSRLSPDQNSTAVLTGSLSLNKTVIYPTILDKNVEKNGRC